MRNKIALFFLVLLPFSLAAQGNFNDFFTNGVLRFDYLLSGSSNVARVTEVQQKRELFWGGTTKIAVEEQTLGNYRFNVKDLATQTIIFRQGFSPLFQEWQTTAEAKKMERAFYQVLRFPFPKSKVLLELECRNRDGKFQTIYSTTIDPSNYFITKELPVQNDWVMVKSSGEPNRKVDIAILAEGYQKKEMEKFVKDARRLVDSLFKVGPFASQQDQFNIYALETPSAESGTDIPGRNIYVNTLFNSSFYTFDVARYLTTTDLKSVSDQAAAVPYDYVIVLVNSKEYGGGGFCNYVSVCTSDHALAANVFIHEFGHEFAGLGDEYYSSEVAYEDFYNLKVEPWEPNLTTMVDFKSKWGALIDPTTPIPTPRTNGYAGKTGVFEGGGYVAKGVFSPMDDCRMKSNKPNSFCPVCQKAIAKVIQRCCE
ncbi:MAG: IgA Peptidase M64 [Prolixibacteraceae bacterium]|jgi:hypothetical protein|nr:IgA Peptidase M64 [Prolixibacteraceae bacterium]